MQQKWVAYPRTTESTRKPPSRIGHCRYWPPTALLRCRMTGYGGLELRGRPGGKFNAWATTIKYPIDEHANGIHRKQQIPQARLVTHTQGVELSVVVGVCHTDRHRGTEARVETQQNNLRLFVFSFVCVTMKLEFSPHSHLCTNEMHTWIRHRMLNQA